MPRENVMAKAKINKSYPLNLAIKEGLKPMIRQTPKNISNTVDVYPTNGINDCGMSGFNDCV